MQIESQHSILTVPLAPELANTTERQSGLQSLHDDQQTCDLSPQSLVKRMLQYVHYSHPYLGQYRLKIRTFSTILLRNNRRNAKTHQILETFDITSVVRAVVRLVGRLMLVLVRYERGN